MGLILHIFALLYFKQAVVFTLYVKKEPIEILKTRSLYKRVCDLIPNGSSHQRLP